MHLILALLLSVQSLAGVVVLQGASASLSSTPSLVTFTTQVQAQGPAIPSYSLAGGNAPITLNVTDNNYQNGVYTCQTPNTISVNAKIAVTGTLAVNSAVLVTIQRSFDNGSTWIDFVTEGAGPTTGLGEAYGKVSNLVPCPQGTMIRIVASTTIVLPTISASNAKNSLTLAPLF